MKSPTVVSVSTINGGSRFNIVPETVEMSGTICTYDAGVRAQVHNDIRQISENIAESANAKAEVEVIELYDPLVNHDKVTAQMAPVLERAADGDVVVTERSGASEDFSFFLTRCLACSSTSALCRRIRTRAKPLRTTAPISTSMTKRWSWV